MVKITVITSLYRCSKYLSSYLSHVKNISNPKEVEVLLLHNDPTPEELDIIKEGVKDIPFIKHIIIPEREGLYATWNRGIKLAQGEYCAIWNVDDVRTPDSLFLQAKALDENLSVDIVYGQFMAVYEYGNIEGNLIVDPAFTPSIARKRHIIGCFPMWRQTIHKKIGYFDEQLKLVADFDFQIRASFKCRLIRVDDFLGYYLEGVSDKLSSNWKLQIIERTKVGLRYGTYCLLDLVYLFANKNIKIGMIRSYNKYDQLSKFIPQIKKYRWKHSFELLIPIIHYPYCFAHYLKHLFDK